MSVNVAEDLAAIRAEQATTRRLVERLLAAIAPEETPPEVAVPEPAPEGEPVPDGKGAVMPEPVPVEEPAPVDPVEAAPTSAAVMAA